MTPSRPASTIADGTSLCLPALDSPATGKPPRQSDSRPVDDTAAVVYSVKLTDDVVKALCAANDDAFVQFTSPDVGLISVPGSEPFKFSTRPIGDGPDSSRAVCYSRRGALMRVVGPITAEIDLDHRMSQKIASTTKKRTLEASHAGKGREVKVTHDLPAPAKKQRVRKTPVEKRPRTTRPTRPSTGLSSSLAPVKMPMPNGHPRPLRSAPTASPSFTPRVESPAPIPPTSRLNGSRRSTPTRALRPPSAQPTLGKISPNNPLFRRVTRGPSPRPSSVHSPNSPKTGNLRPKSEDPAELRRNVIHILALGPTSLHAIKSRVMGSDAAIESRDILFSILQDVGNNCKGSYSLKDSLWQDVSETYEAYSEMERTRMKLARSDALGASPKRGMNGTSGGGTVARTESMTDAQLDAALGAFSKTKPDNLKTKVENEVDEREVRKAYARLHPLYAEVLSRVDNFRTLFLNLDRMFRETKDIQEREKMVARIQTSYNKYRVRNRHLLAVLPVLHSRLLKMRKSLDAWAREVRRNGTA